MTNWKDRPHACDSTEYQYFPFLPRVVGKDWRVIQKAWTRETCWRCIDILECKGDRRQAVWRVAGRYPWSDLEGFDTWEGWTSRTKH